MSYVLCQFQNRDVFAKESHVKRFVCQGSFTVLDTDSNLTLLYYKSPGVAQKVVETCNQESDVIEVRLIGDTVDDALAKEICRHGKVFKITGREKDIPGIMKVELNMTRKYMQQLESICLLMQTCY